MNTVPTPKIAQLNKANYTPWVLSIHGTAASIDATEQVTQDPEPSNDPAALKTFTQKQAVLVGALIDSIPDEITDIVVHSNQRPTPHQLITAVTKYIDAKQDHDHRTLKTMAEATRFTEDMTVAD